MREIGFTSPSKTVHHFYSTFRRRFPGGYPWRFFVGYAIIRADPTSKSETSWWFEEPSTVAVNTRLGTWRWWHWKTLEFSGLGRGPSCFVGWPGAGFKVFFKKFNPPQNWGRYPVWLISFGWLATRKHDFGFSFSFGKNGTFRQRPRWVLLHFETSWGFETTSHIPPIH